jgi:hypothetical protein
MKLRSDGGDCGRNKCKRGYDSACGGGLRIFRLSGVSIQEVGLCIFENSSFSRREDVFTFNLFYKDVLYICTFNYICIDNGAISCTAVQHKELHSHQL